MCCLQSIKLCTSVTSFVLLYVSLLYMLCVLSRLMTVFFVTVNLQDMNLVKLLLQGNFSDPNAVRLYCR